jgi:hypothetical protein
MNLFIRFITSNYVIDVVNRIHSYTKGKPLLDLRVKSYWTNNTIASYFIFTSMFANRTVDDFKYLLEIIFKFLANEFDQGGSQIRGWCLLVGGVR